MREILFKAKKVDNGEWIEGYGVCVIPNSNLASILHFQGNNLMNVTGVIPETVCQFTGLTDKNGTKIFEGDLLAFTDATYTYEVVFNKGSFTCKHTRPGIMNWGDLKRAFDSDIQKSLGGIEVTGNIHDDANKQ